MDTTAMQPTSHAHVNDLLTRLLAQMHAILGDKLVGVYLYGSLVTGDFDDISDVDLLAAVTEGIDAAEFDALDQMHNRIIATDPQWENRLEIAYLSLHALKTFRTQDSPIAIISPGEPFHIRDAGKDWLVNWYMVREKGITLLGLPPNAIIDPIGHDEFIDTVKSHLVFWREWVETTHDRPAQAYAILTMCRALYTGTYGDQVSKRKAALWAAQQFPAWSSLIENALEWRRTSHEPSEGASTFPETRRFVLFTADRLAK